MKKLSKNKKVYLTLLAFAFCLFAWPIGAATTVDFALPFSNSSTYSDPAQYIHDFFIYGLIQAGFLAVGAMVFGGITYLLAGTLTSVERAKKIIGSALTGLILLLCSYLLLYTIDPTLVSLSPYKLPYVNIPAPDTANLPGTANCTSDKKFDITTKTCTPCPDGTMSDPAVGNYYCTAKPAGYDAVLCTKISTCTETLCAQKGTGTTGKCLTGLTWCNRGTSKNVCTCVIADDFNGLCPDIYVPAD